MPSMLKDIGYEITMTVVTAGSIGCGTNGNKAVQTMQKFWRGLYRRMDTGEGLGLVDPILFQRNANLLILLWGNV